MGVFVVVNCHGDFVVNCRDFQKSCIFAVVFNTDTTMTNLSVNINIVLTIGG